MSRSPIEDGSVDIRIRRLSHASDLPLPAYETAGAAGLDVRAAIDGVRQLAPGAIDCIPTGLVVEIPPGYELQLRPRSGLALRHGLTLTNSPATIDSDYRGEVQVILQNTGSKPIPLERGMRIAQMVLHRVPRVSWVEADELEATPRGPDGFGSTGGI